MAITVGSALSPAGFASPAQGVCRRWRTTRKNLNDINWPAETVRDKALQEPRKTTVLTPLCRHQLDNHFFDDQLTSNFKLLFLKDFLTNKENFKKIPNKLTNNACRTIRKLLRM
ncbi:hypothetical protein EON09_01720 [Pseudomonas soli]|uniref:hypothetical protein n=1 Tax=Pseudomonas soli TaxID=1306993 RepID=UPI001364BF69|nr:hypothetical protein [Pseudomonas soli]NBK37243.1 hypothetical protein [Pseudomonas soli]